MKEANPGGSSRLRGINDLERYVVDEGEPWFERFQEPEDLLTSSDSPLRQPEKERLRAAVGGQADADAVVSSLKLLGIKTT